MRAIEIIENFLQTGRIGNLENAADPVGMFLVMNRRTPPRRMLDEAIKALDKWGNVQVLFYDGDIRELMRATDELYSRIDRLMNENKKLREENATITPTDCR